MKYLFFLIIFISSAHAEDVNVIATLPCGVAGTPACQVEISSAGAVVPTLTSQDASINPDFSIIQIATPSLSFAFPFQKIGCAQVGPVRSIQGRSIQLNIDYCKVAGVVNDVASLLAYIITAGYLLHLATKPKES